MLPTYTADYRSAYALCKKGVHLSSACLEEELLLNRVLSSMGVLL